MAVTGNFLKQLPEEKGSVVLTSILDEYIRHLLSYVDVSQMKPLKIVVNAGNGCAGPVVKALEKQLPLLAICRGLQELVVASGGKLHRQLHRIPGLQEHRENEALTLDEQYAPAHEVWLEPGGLLAPLVNHCEKFWVNSLHGQGIREAGSALRVEARAADGLIEAVSHRQHPFALAVQWHPEWHSDSSALSRQLFDGFIHACQQFQKGSRL